MYLVMDIGCIECGADSAVVGIFSDKDYALELAKFYNSSRQYNWTGGQHNFEVFDLLEPDVINPEYKENTSAE